MGSSQNGLQTAAAATSKTAGIIIIGDEVLKGHVTDVNSGYLAKELYSIGVKLCRIATIPDDLTEIAAEVLKFSNTFDYVFTTGGIGPTHDDITYQGVAQAFSQRPEVNQDMARMLRKSLGNKGYDPELLTKMALMSPDARLLFDPSTVTSFPVVNVHNVYIFPGIPQYVRKLFPRIRSLLVRSTLYSRTIYIDRAEMSITPELNTVVDRFNDVTFGSYPILDNLYYSTKITLESTVAGRIEEAVDFFQQSLPSGSVVEYDPDPVSTAGSKVYAIVKNLTDPLHSPVVTAVEVIERALDQYGLGSICLCFNGGKDCTALLHLFEAVLQKRHSHRDSNTAATPTKFKSLSIQHPDQFPEMEVFIDETSKRYNLTLWTYDGPIKTGLTSVVKEHPTIKAVLTGVRRADPSGKSLGYFQMTDPDWPTVMRVSPILDWTYSQVWAFLRTLTLPYCPIYNRGYTSIGSQSNTLPNEALKRVDPSGEVSYRPAYTLDDAETERNGRQ